MYTTKLLTDREAVFVLLFDEEEIEVAKCVKTDSGKWRILSETIPESARKPFMSPEQALEAYKAYIRTMAEEE